MDLNDVLSDKVETPEPPVVTETPAPSVETGTGKGARQEFQDKEQAAQAEGRARAADGKFVAADPAKPEPAKADEKPPEPEKPAERPPVQDMTDKEKALLAAARDERSKRQQLEQEMAQLRAQLQPKAEPQPAKTFWEAPEEALNAFEQRIVQNNQQMQQTFLQQRVAATEAAAKVRYADFNQVIPVFADIVRAPGVYQEWINSPDPAEYAYRASKNLKELRDAGSLESVRANAEKEARIKIEAEYKDKEVALTKQRDELPGSLSDARGTSQPRVTWGGPPPLDNILSMK